jgi:site-specific recombinase XerD
MSSTPPATSARLARGGATADTRADGRLLWVPARAAGDLPQVAPAAQDYALVRTLYHAGLRAEEAVSLEVADLHFTRGPFGKLHVRYGKAARGSGPRPRWVPMLDQLDLVLRWYLTDVRPRFGGGSALFCDEGGGRMHKGSVRKRLAHLLKLEGRPVAEGFTPMGCAMPA